MLHGTVIILASLNTSGGICMYISARKRGMYNSSSLKTQKSVILYQRPMVNLLFYSSVIRDSNEVAHR